MNFLESLQRHLPPGYTLRLKLTARSMDARVYDPAGGDCSGMDRFPAESFVAFCRRLVNDAREIEGLEPA
jgi:hypothetical protein